MAAALSSASSDVDRNEVQLSGRLSSIDPARAMPSGDQLIAFRIVVRRPASRGASAGIDVVDCQVRSARLRRAAERWPIGVQIELKGRLRRRFYRGPGGLQSRYAVDVASARRLGPEPS